MDLSASHLPPVQANPQNTLNLEDLDPAPRTASKPATQDLDFLDPAPRPDARMANKQASKKFCDSCQKAAELSTDKRLNAALKQIDTIQNETKPQHTAPKPEIPLPPRKAATYAQQNRTQERPTVQKQTAGESWVSHKNQTQKPSLLAGRNELAAKPRLRLIQTQALSPKLPQTPSPAAPVVRQQPSTAPTVSSIAVPASKSPEANRPLSPQSATPLQRSSETRSDHRSLQGLIQAHKTKPQGVGWIHASLSLRPPAEAPSRAGAPATPVEIPETELFLKVSDAGSAAPKAQTIRPFDASGRPSQGGKIPVDTTLPAKPAPFIRPSAEIPVRTGMNAGIQMPSPVKQANTPASFMAHKITQRPNASTPQIAAAKTGSASAAANSFVAVASQNKSSALRLKLEDKIGTLVTGVLGVFLKFLKRRKKVARKGSKHSPDEDSESSSGECRQPEASAA